MTLILFQKWALCVASACARKPTMCLLRRSGGVMAAAAVIGESLALVVCWDSDRLEERGRGQYSKRGNRQCTVNG